MAKATGPNSLAAPTPGSSGEEAIINPHLKVLGSLCGLLNQDFLLVTLCLSAEGELALAFEQTVYEGVAAAFSGIKGALAGFNGLSQVLGEGFSESIREHLETGGNKPLPSEPHPIELEGFRGFTALALPGSAKGQVTLGLLAPSEEEYKQAGELALCVSSDLQRNGNSLLTAARELSSLKSDYKEALPKGLESRLEELEVLLRHCGIGDINNACRLDSRGIIGSDEPLSGEMLSIKVVMEDIIQAINEPQNPDDGEFTPDITSGYSIRGQFEPGVEELFLEISPDTLAYALGEQIMFAELPLRYGLLMQPHGCCEGGEFTCKVSRKDLPDGRIMGAITVGLKGPLIPAPGSDEAGEYSPATANTLRASLELLAKRCKGSFRSDTEDLLNSGSVSTVFWPAKTYDSGLSAPKSAFDSESDSPRTSALSEGAVSRLKFSLRVL